MSYNFDESDPMTDYFHTELYLTLGILQDSRTGWNCKDYGKRALLKCSGILKTRLCEQHGRGAFQLHGENRTLSERRRLTARGRTFFSPKEYSSAKTAHQSGKLKGSRECMRTDTRHGCRTPARIYCKSESGTGKAGICHGIPEVGIRTRHIPK